MKISKRVLVIILIIALFIPFSIWQNNSLDISEFTYQSSKLPSDFDGFKIVHISDLHNKMFGDNQCKLLDAVKSQSPDIIVITGDLIDRRRFNLENAMSFINGAKEIAPIYYVSGNHEAYSGKYYMITKELLEAGVFILDDISLELIQGNSTVQIMGLLDPGFITKKGDKVVNTTKMKNSLSAFNNLEGFKILLSHRPEYIKLYSRYNIDMIFSGHAHGGQIRLPIIGPIIAPGQGYFPKITNGRYDEGSSTLYVSRGLGNSAFPLRVFNYPHIVSVTLKKG